MSRPTTLALRALGLGDFLTGLPALTLLKRARPESTLILAAPAVFAPYVDLVDDIDALYPVGELEPLTGFDRPVTLGVDLHGKGPASRRLVDALHPTELLGFEHPSSNYRGPAWFPDEHEVTRWCRLVAEGLGIDLPFPSVRGRMRRPPVSAPSGLTVVHPGAASASRRWPADRFAAVAAALVRHRHRVVVTGGAAEVDLARSVAEPSGALPMLGLSLTELAAVVADARVVVCGDTGVAHLASAFGVPSVVLCGPVSPAWWGPPADGPHIALFRGDGSGDPHGSTPDPALLGITVPDVLSALARLDQIPTGALP